VFASLLLRNYSRDQPNARRQSALPTTHHSTSRNSRDARTTTRGRNLRDRKQRLRQSEESLRRLIGAIPQIVWTNNADGTTNYFNSRWYEYTGLNYEQSARPSWQAVIHPDDAWASKERWQDRSQDWQSV
jgi:PAS domain-containing protein